MTKISKLIDYNATTIYKSPEMINPKGKIIGPPADIWMLGCIAYILAYGRHPFEGVEEKDIPNFDIAYSTDDLLTDLIKDMLKIDAQERLTACEITQKLDEQIATLKRTEGIGWYRDVLYWQQYQAFELLLICSVNARICSTGKFKIA